MRIFLSYPHEHRRVAEAIRLALEDGGHDVFFDRADLEPGESYIVTIRQRLERSDLFVFLLSPYSLQAGRFTLTELSLAEKKWRRPHQHVLPVLVAPLSGHPIPPFLAAVGILEPRGDVSAEVANQVEVLARQRRDRRLSRRLAFGLGGLGLLAAGGLLFSVWSGTWVPHVMDRLRAALPGPAWTPDTQTSPPGFSGTWRVVPNGTRQDLPSQFLFQPEGEVLSGVAFYAGRAMRILDGKVGGAKVTFSVKRSYVHDGQTVEETDRYRGELAGAEINFLLTVERRDTVIRGARFVARQLGAVGPPAATLDPVPSARCHIGDELGRLELRDEDVSRQATLYLICQVRNREGLFAKEDGVAIEERPFGHRRFFSTRSIAQIAMELEQRTWACGAYDESQRILMRSEVMPAPVRAGSRYVLCQTAGKATSLELRVARREADGSIGPERQIVVKLPE
jgi:TIR domain